MYLHEIYKMGCDEMYHQIFRITVCRVVITWVGLRLLLFCQQSIIEPARGIMKMQTKLGIEDINPTSSVPR